MAIIGAGVVGSAIARELAGFHGRFAVFEKEPDVAFGTSCRNSGVLHSGINYPPGTNRARLSVIGNSMMDDLCSKLKVPIKRIGKLTVALSEEDLPGLHLQYEQGKANAVEGMELLDNAAMQKIQPGVSGILGLWTPTSAIISPYGLTIALAENANANGVDYHLNSEITSIHKSERGAFELSVKAGQKYRARLIINAAGLYADEINRMLGAKAPGIWPCRGEYYVLDKRLRGSLNTLIYPVPGPNDPGLGIHLTPTVDGNILIGPSANYTHSESRENYRVTAPVMSDLRKEGARMLPSLASGDFIRSFAGNRPKLTPPEVSGNSDFIIEEAKDIPGFIYLLGIESPGLTSAPAIAKDVCKLLAKRFALTPRDGFIAERNGFAGHFADLPKDVRMSMIEEEPEYGEIVCRCEKISKKEVRDAIENCLGALTMLSLKYRARVMMGRCQGGFCLPRIVRMLRDEYGCKPDEYLLKSQNSPLFVGYVREAV